MTTPLSETAQRLVDEALRLPESERVAVWTALGATLPEEGELEPNAEFLAEIRRRRDRYLRGETKGVTFEELKARIEAKRAAGV